MTMRLIIGGKTAIGKPLEPESEVDVDPETVEPVSVSRAAYAVARSMPPDSGVS